MRPISANLVPLWEWFKVIQQGQSAETPGNVRPVEGRESQKNSLLVGKAPAR